MHIQVCRHTHTHINFYQLSVCGLDWRGTGRCLVCRSMVGKRRDVGEEACCYGVCFVGVGGGLCLHGYFLWSPPLNGCFLLQGAQVALCVCVFYSQVDHGECSQVSVRCQVVTCLRVFKAAFAWIVFTAHRARRRGGRITQAALALIWCRLFDSMRMSDWVSVRKKSERYRWSIWVHACFPTCRYLKTGETA